MTTPVKASGAAAILVVGLVASADIMARVQIDEGVQG